MCANAPSSTTVHRLVEEQTYSLNNVNYPALSSALAFQAKFDKTPLKVTGRITEALCYFWAGKKKAECTESCVF
jgi:hypothetical protein